MADIQQGSDNTNAAANNTANQPGEAFRQDYLSELAGPPGTGNGGKIPERPEYPQGEPAGGAGNPEQPSPSGGDADPPRQSGGSEPERPRHGDADPPRQSGGDADPPRQSGGDADPPRRRDADPERPSDTPPGSTEHPSPGGSAGSVSGGGDQPITQPPAGGSEQPGTGDPTHEMPRRKDPKNTEGTFPSVHDHDGEMPPKKGQGGDLIIPPLDYGSGAGSGPK